MPARHKSEEFTMSNNQSGKFSMLTKPGAGTTGTGLDQLVEVIFTDTGLAGSNMASELLAGAAAANGLNKIILQAATATGAAADGKFTAAEVVAMNGWIRANKLTEWTALHGDDEGDAETGFHLVQNDGANLQYRGSNLVNTVADGIYHMGFEIKNGSFVNEDGDANASVNQVAAWLTQFYTDHSTTGTGLDRITNTIMADAGLAANISDRDIASGADMANQLNQLIIDGLKASSGWTAGKAVTTADVVALNSWIRADAARYARFLELHGDDENGAETGYHIVQNDGANTPYFGKNLVNTVADGIYHIGFEIRDGRFLNEDGNANAKVSDVASWLNYFLGDASTTGTGLDRIVDTIKADTGLARWTSAADINAGAAIANELNKLVLEAVAATNAMADGWLTSADLQAMNTWLRADPVRYARFLELHGDDENGEETGYHLVQNDGANTNYFGRNLINGPADSIYHFGFTIKDGRFLNEDGDANAALSDVAAWLNYFIKGSTLVVGSDGPSMLTGTDGQDQVMGLWNNDTIDAGAGDDLIEGGWGSDVIRGGAGNDMIFGQGSDDTIDGGHGSDRYQVSGNQASGWSSFEGFDTYADKGTSGTDTIVATGASVDIGMRNFSAASSGIEVIDATGATGTSRILGDWSADTLDMRGVQLKGNIVIDGAYGNDTIIGSASADTIVGGGGDDSLDGGGAGDTYRVTGNQAAGWSSFQGFDTYADTGTSGTDTVVALGTGDVDIGVKAWGSSTGIEVINATGATGTVRLLGDSSANTLNLSSTTLTGSNIVIDGGHGNDTITGNGAANTLMGSGGNDKLDGGNGGDTYRVTGNQAGGWSSFHGFDTYADTGTSGTDTLRAIGTGNVDIGLAGWVNTGIEAINATGATGTVRLLGDGAAETFDFRTTTLTGSNIVIDASWGNDTVYGSAAADTISASYGDDRLDGGAGGDTYRVTGNQAGGWSSFNGFDTYADTGTSGTDRIVISGKDVDLGLRSFSASGSGIEVIDASAATGTTRIVGDWSADSIDLRGVSVLGSGIVIDGAGGNDTLIGAAGNDSMRGGSGNDLLVGGAGQDSLDGGDGNDLLLATQGSGSGRELYIGGAGGDRIALALNDRSALDLRGGSATAADGAADTFTLVGTRGALSFTASVLDFEVGKDRLDFSQLRDSGNNVLGMEDLVISASGGHTQIGFAAGVHAVGGGAVDVQLTLMGVGSVAASSFSFTAPSLGWGVGTLETAFAYL